MSAPLERSQIEAIRSLEEHLGGLEHALIGACALRVNGHLLASTLDVDVVVRASHDDLRSRLGGARDWDLIEEDGVRWRGPSGASVDLLPMTLAASGRPEIQAGRTERLNGAGCEIALLCSARREISPRVSSPVATTPSVLLLKMVAWLDRPAEREKDLTHIWALMSQYVDDEEPRRFSDIVYDVGLTWESVSPFFLGLDLGEVIGSKYASEVDTFFEKLRGEAGEYDPMMRATRARLPFDPDDDVRRRGSIERGVSALRAGIEEGRREAP